MIVIAGSLGRDLARSPPLAYIEALKRDNLETERPMRMMILALACAALAGCQQAPAEAPAPVAPAAAGAPVAYAIETVAEGLSFPWSLAFLPNGDMLVTERDGRLRIVRDGALDPTPIPGAPEVLAENQGGLHEVSLHPQFAQNELVYLSYAAGTEQANATRVARARFDGRALSDLQVIFEASPAKAGGAHFGGRMLWLPDGTFLLTLGDGFRYREKAQDKTSHLGKIVRLDENGRPPADNPFLADKTVKPEIFTLGHRNVQGVARDPATGALYAHEHGPRGGDEVNVLVAGRNYGWPVITYGRDYSGAMISPFTEKPGLEQPLVQWTPSIAPAGLAFYTGDAFPTWKGDLFTAALAGMKVQRVDLEAGKVVGEEALFTEVGERLRDVRQGPDGFVYLLTDSGDGKILRVRPK